MAKLVIVSVITTCVAFNAGITYQKMVTRKAIEANMQEAREALITAREAVDVAKKATNLTE